MNLESLRFLAQPAVVIPWYGIGAVAAIWVLYDTFTANRDVGPALEAAWPIMVLFLSFPGVVLYVASCRPKHIGSIRKRDGDEEAKRVHHEFVAVTWWLVTIGWKHGMT